MTSSVNLRSLLESGENGIPVFSINTDFEIVDDPKVLGTFSVSSGSESISGNLAIEIRGSSSQEFNKKPYGFETRDDQNADLDVSILGLPEEEDWILNPSYIDKSLVRNVLMYDLSREMGHYASRTRYVDLYLNNEYMGVYILMEKLKRGPDRINISKNKLDVTGGYILKVDRPPGNGNFTDENSFKSIYGSNLDGYRSNDVHYLYEYPKSDEITQEQKDYISGYVIDFETALASDDFTNNGMRYDSYIDVDNFVDFMILNEITNNVDSYRLSTFMHKDAGGKLKMGPVWDFDVGFGNTVDCNREFTNSGFISDSYCTLQIVFWFRRLMEDPEFVEKVQMRWIELRKGVLSEESVLSKIDSYVSEIGNSINKNFEKWDIIGNYVWPRIIGQTYEEEVDFVKSWLSERMVWMDEAIESGRTQSSRTESPTPATPGTPSPSTPGTPVTPSTPGTPVTPSTPGPITPSTPSTPSPESSNTSGTPETSGTSSSFTSGIFFFGSVLVIFFGSVLGSFFLF